MKKSPQQRANLRVCGCCEWIYRGPGEPCPKCGFASFGARWVYGKIAYAYAVTQKPWYDKKMVDRACELRREIRDSNPIKKKKSKSIWDRGPFEY